MSFKATFLILLVVAAMVITTSQAYDRVRPCDQVCDRSDAEKDECCRAHGYPSGHHHCVRGMYCGDCC